MLLVILTDKIGADFVLLTTLIFFMVTGITAVKDGLVGFSNSGVLTVMTLFVVAEGVSRTGSLDYYMGKLLGKPKTIASAQIRLMIPIAILSAFLNNTPIVAVMIPLVKRWAKTQRLPEKQLLIPLSFATILGGTCTLVGTSTNLVVSGLLAEDYPDEPAGRIGLFDLGKYGVPNLLFGLSYIVIFSPFLLPDGRTTRTDSSSEADELLLGARVTQWSPAAGRTVERSGLGNSGGIYLVNVRRSATGNVKYGVSKDFVLSVGDELYFTGEISGFGDFCEKHALDIISAEGLATKDTEPSYAARNEVGSTLESVTQGDSVVLLQAFNLLSDQIAGREPVEPGLKPTRAIIVGEASSKDDRAVLVGIDCFDRDGLLADISQNLFQNGLKVRTSEAQVFYERSLSVWRCEAVDSTKPDREEIWLALSELLHLSKEVAATRKRGLKIVRASIPKSSCLIGRKPAESKFRELYKANIVAYQKRGRNTSIEREFTEGDLLLLEVFEGSPLLNNPSENPKDTKGKHVVSTTEDDEESLGTTRALRDLKVEFEEDNRNNEVPKGEFLVALVIPPGSPFVNQSVSEVSTSPGIVLVGIERPADDVEFKVNKYLSPDDILREGDILWMSGSAEAIADLQNLHGAVFYHQDQIEKAASLQDRRMVQAVIARGSPLVGTTVAQAHFRTVYGGAVLAIQRGGERVHEHPGRVQLQMGDALLIQAGPEFDEKHKYNYRTFALVSEVENSAPPRPRLFLLCVGMIIVSLVVASLGIRDLLVTATIVGIVMVSLGVVTQQEARDSVHWDLFIVIASAFGIGSAMETSGFAGLVATVIVSVGDAIGLGGRF
jgi:di/tricarboxylate transporter